MCGIGGILALGEALPPTAEQILAMCDVMYHRGPDDCGFAVHEKVAMGMRRLSIIDVAGGHQPVSNEDRSVRVVFNGEIYNYRELRRALESAGHEFRTNTDTEVIVHLWEDHGPAMLEKLDGMFVIALHDIGRQRLFLARDHLGIKPLFYAHTETHFVFGSEVKAVLASGLVDRDLDVDGLAQFLAWEYVPGEGTLHRAIRKLEAGCMIEIDLQSERLRKSSYWDVPMRSADATTSRSTDDWTDAIDDAIRKNVRRQLVSDVPLGAFLSGGVDSSLVVAAMGEAAITFSIGFDDPTYNELHWARRVASHLRVQHSYEVIQPQVTELFEHLMHFMDDPIGDFSIFPTYLVSKHARQAVTVALSGDGGDELFGGYETYIAQERARLWMKLPEMVRKGVLEPAMRICPPSAKKKGLVNKAKRFVAGFENGEDLGHARWRVFVGEAMREALFTPDALAQIETPVGRHIELLRHRCAEMDDCDRTLYVDLRSYLVDNCLVKTDRMSMATSLEVRVPLLAREVVELAALMPSKLKVARGRTKVLLKEVAARHVPRDCVYRPKEGFSVPIKHWLNGPLRPMVEELLSPARIRAEGIFDFETIERLKREHQQNRANHSHILWSLLVFQDWRKRWAS